MKTFAFQVELEVSSDQDLRQPLQETLELIVEHLAVLKKPGEDPPFRITVIELGWK